MLMSKTPDLDVSCGRGAFHPKPDLFLTLCAAPPDFHKDYQTSAPSLKPDSRCSQVAGWP